MIRLEKTGDCVGCPGIDLEIATLYIGDETVQRVICKNERLCKRLKKAWEERKEQTET